MIQTVKAEPRFPRVEIVSFKVDVEKITRTLTGQESFHFYNAIGFPTGETATSLEDFEHKMETINLASINFHYYRGDFERWIRDTLRDPVLASKLDPLENKTNFQGESLKQFIIKQVKNRLCELKGIFVEFSLNYP